MRILWVLVENPRSRLANLDGIYNKAVFAETVILRNRGFESWFMVSEDLAHRGKIHNWWIVFFPKMFISLFVYRESDGRCASCLVHNSTCCAMDTDVEDEIVIALAVLCIAQMPCTTYLCPWPYRFSPTSCQRLLSSPVSSIHFETWGGGYCALHGTLRAARARPFRAHFVGHIVSFALVSFWCPMTPSLSSALKFTFGKF